VNHAQPRAGEHRDRQFRDHRHMQGHTVAGLQPAELAQQGRELVDAYEEILVRDVLNRFVLGLWHEMDRRLVLVLGEVSIDAVVAGVDLAADEPAPEWRVAGVERPFPVPGPVEQVCKLLEALAEPVEGKTLKDTVVCQIGLRDEPGFGGE
jgi:hypothetical protein